MRLLVCAGASGGGVYPALAVLQALADDAEEVLWVGSAGGMEVDLVNRAGIAYKSVPAAGLHGVGLRALPGNLQQLLRGYAAARPILDAFNPDLLFFTGGYVAVPTALAGRRLPTLVYVPDIEPALALRLVSRFADQVAVTTEAGRGYFPRRKPVTVTGYPVRADLASWGRAQAYGALDLSPELPTLLVFGGSKGARSINRALLAVLEDLLAEAQLVHISGALTWPEVSAARKALPPEAAARYHPFPYLHARMGAALAAADLVVSRAGASTLGEFPAFGLPAVLVPYPYAWRYQKVNARYLVDRGGALMLRDEDLRAELLPTVRALLRDADKRSQMQKAMRETAKPEAAAHIADLLRAMLVQLEGRVRPS